jgi:AraC-like DNA-binding protein
MFPAATNRAQRIISQLELAESLGLDRRQLLDSVGLEESDIADPDNRVPILKAVRLLQIMANQTEDEDIGLKLGQRIEVRNVGVVGYAMAHSNDLESAAQRLIRFQKILNQRAEARFTRDGDRWRLIFMSEPLIEGFRPALDDYMAAIVFVFGELIGRTIEPAETDFMYSKPAETSLHRAIFGSRIRFGCQKQMLAFWDRDIQTPLGKADPQLTGYLDEVAEIRLDSLPKDDTFAARVRRAIWPHLSEGQPKIGAIASDLAVSSRTLQRRLREEDTSYGDVIEALRREKAVLLLRDPNLAVYEIGYLLGYSDPSAFYRAFRRWHGDSPSKYRQLMS